MPTNTVTPDWLVRLERGLVPSGNHAHSHRQRLAGDIRAENDALGLRSDHPLEAAVDRPTLVLIRGGRGDA